MKKRILKGLLVWFRGQNLAPKGQRLQEGGFELNVRQIIMTVGAQAEMSCPGGSDSP